MELSNYYSSNNPSMRREYSVRETMEMRTVGCGCAGSSRRMYYEKTETLRLQLDCPPMKQRPKSVGCTITELSPPKKSNSSLKGSASTPKRSRNCRNNSSLMSSYGVSPMRNRSSRCRSSCAPVAPRNSPSVFDDSDSDDGDFVSFCNNSKALVPVNQSSSRNRSSRGSFVREPNQMFYEMGSTMNATMASMMDGSASFSPVHNSTGYYY